MVNVNKLRGVLAERGLSVVSISHKIGIDKATFYRKLNGKGEMFTIREADLIVKELALTKDEAIAIFFNQFVSKMRIPECNGGYSFASDRGA